jgi:hypothetical protein
MGIRDSKKEKNNNSEVYPAQANLFSDSALKQRTYF